MSGNPIVEKWLSSLFVKKCWICPQFLNERWPTTLQVHHIERRAHAIKSRYDIPENFFLTCLECHNSALDIMPHPLQLNYKMKFDLEHYDLEKWLRIRDPELRAPDRVTQEEVDNYSI